MAQKVFRVGVIGVGAIAQNAHIPGYVASKHCQVVAVADPEKKCVDMCRKAGLPIGTVYTDYQEMLKKEELDVVSVCTPNCFHKEMAVAVAKAGCTMLLEKPIALTMPDALAIQKAVTANKVRVMTSFTHRFNPLNIAARKALLAGKIGTPQMIRIRFVHGGPFPGWAKTDWFYNPKLAGGGGGLDMGIHAYDLARWYIGPVTAVQGMVKTLRKKIAVDDSCHALLDFGGKCIGHIEAGWTGGNGFSGVEIVGDTGSLLVNYRANEARIIVSNATPSGTSKTKESILLKNPSLGSWVAQMKYFSTTLVNGKTFTPDVSDGVESLRIALAAFASEKTGKRVAIQGK